MRRFVQLGSLFAIGLAVAACSGSSASPSTAPSIAPSVAPSASAGGGGGTGTAVTIKGFAFNPATLSVTVGQTVTWTNEDDASHTVTFDSGGAASDKLGKGATYSQTFTTAGTFAYHCAIHTSMKATITVTP